MNKEKLKDLHRKAVVYELKRHQNWVQRVLLRYLDYFASGSEIVPERIDPCLIAVESSWQSDLFRLGRLLWSLPFSYGFGRRLRFLVMDRSNNKLMGLLALQSPPLDFSVRDRLFAYPPGRKVEKVNQTMDIHTLGAIPPYNHLLGGKLIALLASSNEVRASYRQKYASRISTIPAELVALTTTSAFGRSSIYNRLTYRGSVIAQSIGFTKGYGIFHLLDIYDSLKEYLKEHNIPIRKGINVGPRPKWQTITIALKKLGLPQSLLKHGVEREVFLFPLVYNLQAYMEGREEIPAYRDLPACDLISFWKERWLMPRSQRNDTWKTWNNREVITTLCAFST